jgi:hypothetical protein
LSQKVFLRDVSIVALLSAVSALLVAEFALTRDVPISFWLCFAFIVVLTIGVHFFLVKANKGRPAQFVASFMGALSAKLLLSAGLLLVVGLIDPENLDFTAVGFFLIYSLLTVAELRNLLPLVRQN